MTILTYPDRGGLGTPNGSDANPGVPYSTICIGDSITDASYAFSDLAFQRNGLGPGTKYAYPGKKAGEILSLIPSGLTGHIAIMAGTNDLFYATPLAQFAADYEALCTKAAASGRSEITCIGIPPNDTAGIAAGLHNAYNLVIWMIAKRGGYKYANPWKAITTLAGRCVSGTMNDATHPKDASHFLVCPTLAATMQSTISDPPLKFSNGGGSVANPVFIDSNADGLADSLAVVTANAGVTPSIAAGSYGNKQIFTCNIASGIYQVRQYGIAANAGDSLLIVAKLKTSSMSNLRANLLVKPYASSTQVGGTYVFYRYQFDGEFIEILPYVLPATTTSFSVNIDLDAGAYPAIGTVEVECFEVYNLTAMGIAGLV